MTEIVLDSVTHSLSLAWPEVALAVGAMVLLLVGAYGGKAGFKIVTWGALALMAIAAFLIVTATDTTTPITAFGGSFIVDAFTTFTKLLVLGAAGVAIIMAVDYIRIEKMDKFEFPILIVLATLGMMIMISANDLITLYMGLELQSLSLYVLAAFNRDSLRSTESGMKYFVLGALSSGLLLYGCSLIFGFSGTTNFTVLSQMVLSEQPVGTQIGLIFGLAFLLSGLAFKISAVPFHMWTPDVYEGAPTPVTAFFAAAPKVAAMALIIRVTMGAFPPSEGIQAPWQQILIFVSVGSMILGAFAAIGQTNIKRLMAYSSIGHMGYAVAGLAAGTELGVKGVLLYMFVYVFMTIGVFACILSMRRKEGMVENISDLAGMSRNHPLTAFVLAMLMFSLAGIPPLAGFFGKWYVFIAVVEVKLYWLAVVAFLSSVVAAFYYLRIVKVIYLDEPVGAFVPMSTAMTIVIGASGLFNLLFMVFASIPLGWIQTAASALF